MRPQPELGEDVQQGSGSGGEVGLIDHVQKQAGGASQARDALLQQHNQ